MSAEPQIAQIIVDFDGSNVAADIITLIKLPPGAMVLPALSRCIITGDPGSVLVVHIGDVVQRQRYAVGVDCSNLGMVEFVNANIPSGVLTRVKVAESADATQDTTLVTMQLNTVTAHTAGRVVVMLAYATI